MHEYDDVLRHLLRDSPNTVLERLTGAAIARWLPTERTKSRAVRMDLLGETEQGELIHIELQSAHDPEMPLRMAEYLLAAYRQLGRFPRQIVIYLGAAPLRMRPSLIGPHCSFSYTVIDIRQLDAGPLLASPLLADNVLAVLGRTKHRRGTVRKVLERIAGSEQSMRHAALQRLLLLAGLRRMADEIREEAEHMPIMNDIMDHEVFGPLIRKGQAQGRKEGLAEGLAEGLIEGKRELLHRMIQNRFGILPAKWMKKFEKLDAVELDELGIRLFEATTIADLFQAR